MNKNTSLLALTLLLASSTASAADAGSADLTYCLEMKSNSEIAKCAGEVSAGNKGKAYTKEQVDEILSKEKASAPATAPEPAVEPPSANDNAAKNLAPAD